MRDIFERFEFHTQIERLAKSGLLYLVAEKFANIDLHPETVSNAQMGLVFEELIRKFAEISNIIFGNTLSNDGAECQDYLSLMANVGIIPYADKGDIGNKKPEDLSKCKLVARGDFVINSMNYGLAPTEYRTTKAFAVPFTSS